MYIFMSTKISPTLERNRGKEVKRYDTCKLCEKKREGSGFSREKKHERVMILGMCFFF